MTTGRKLGLVCIVAAVAIALLWLLTPRRNTESKVAVLAKTEATDSPSASSAIQDEPWTRGEVPSVVTDPTPGRASESPAIPMHPEVTLEQLPRVGFECMEVQVVDGRDRSALPWTTARIHFADGTAVTSQPDPNGFIRFDASKWVDSLEVAFATSAGTTWSDAQLEPLQPGTVLALAPCLFVGRILAVGAGFDDRVDAQVSGFSISGASGTARSLSDPLPQASVGSTPGELVICVGTRPDFSPSAAGDGGIARVLFSAKGRQATAWLAEIPLPGFASNPPVPIRPLRVGALRIIVRNAVDWSPVVGVNVALAPEGVGPAPRVLATDAGGNADFDGVAAGSYRVFVRADGYQDYIQRCAVESAAPDLYVDLTPFASTHDVTVTALLSESADVDALNVTLEGRQLRSLLKSSKLVLEATPGARRASARFQGIPSGEYDVKIWSVIPPTSELGSAVLTVPQLETLSFDLTGAESPVVLQVSSAGPDSGPMELWLQEGDELRLVASGIRKSEFSLQVARPAASRRWMLAGDGRIPHLGTTAEWHSSGADQRHFQASVTIRSGWGIVVLVCDSERTAMAGVTLELPGLGPKYSSITDRDGYATLSVPESPKYLPTTTRATTRDGRTIELSISTARFQRLMIR